eukprot:5537021-Alexandrium_andersonii.AAC.1
MGASPGRLRSKWWSFTAHPGLCGSSRVAVWAGGALSLGPARLLISRRVRPVSPTASRRRGVASAAGKGCVPSALG